MGDINFRLPLPPRPENVSGQVEMVPLTLYKLFGEEHGSIVMLCMDKLEARIRQDRGSLSSLINDLGELNVVFNHIDEGRPIMMPVLNSRRRDVTRQMVVDAGRHQLYALRNRGLGQLPVIVPQGLMAQFEAQFGVCGTSQ